jgi:hypothetical protein
MSPGHGCERPGDVRTCSSSPIKGEGFSRLRRNALARASFSVVEFAYGRPGMDKRLTLSAFASLVVAAGALGVHLGQAAIDDINPLYFQGAAVHPRDRGAEVSEIGLEPQAPAFAQLYGWEQGQAARNADCGDCAALGARDAHAGGDVRFAVLQTAWRTEAQPVSYRQEAEPDGAAGQQPPQPVVYIVENADVSRYASYPIEAQPQGEGEAAADEEAAAEE